MYKGASIVELLHELNRQGTTVVVGAPKSSPLRPLAGPATEPPAFITGG